MRSCGVFILLTVLSLRFTTALAAPAEQKWWKTWPNYPNVARISADTAKSIVKSGDKVAFVYAGYKKESVVCGSVFVDFMWVPPNGDGSRVKLNLPKDYWLLCY